MRIPFSRQAFFEVFEAYNLAVWPAQILLIALAVAALVTVIRPVRHGDATIAAILAAFWMWMGVVYHMVYFTAINPAAWGFGTLFVLQGLVFLLAGVYRGRLSFRYRSGAVAHLGSILILYALLIYPLLGYLLGHRYPESPTFGLPCPTTIFTFGLLLWTDRKVPYYVLIIPVLWAVVGFSAALSLGVLEDIGLLVAAVVAVGALRVRNRSRPEKAAV